MKTNHYFNHKAGIKIKLLEQDGIYSLLGDLIDLLAEEEAKENNEPVRNWTISGKMWILDRLKMKYFKILEKQNSKQISLFDDKEIREDPVTTIKY